MGSVYKEQLNNFVTTLELKGDVLLDWGGAQNPIKGRTKAWDIIDYKVVDLEVPHSDSPKPDIVQDANEPLSGDIVKYVSKTDILIAFGIYDYVINPNVCTDSIAQLLSPDGYAWIEWPFAYAHHEPLMDEGCRYSEGCLNRLLKQSGLKIEVMHRKMEQSGYLKRFYAEDRMRFARSYPYHGVTGFITKVRHG